jgi:hypothetical protein
MKRSVEIKYWGLAALLLLLPSSSKTSGPSKIILERMLLAIKEIRTLRYELEATERIGEKAHSATSNVKINIKPRKIYFKSLNKRIEILYVENTNKDHALVNPNRFPSINLNLDPLRSLMRQNQHHTIFELGYSQIGQITHAAMERYGENFDRHFFYLGTVVHQGKTCDKIYAEFPGFQYIRYITGHEENIRGIANKRAIGEYRIYEKNKGVKFHEVLPKGRVLNIPSDYGSKIILHIDRETHLPLYISAFDDRGFYESYSFSKVSVNTPIKEKEFSKDYFEYNF